MLQELVCVCVCIYIYYPLSQDTSGTWYIWWIRTPRQQGLLCISCKNWNGRQHIGIISDGGSVKITYFTGPEARIKPSMHAWVQTNIYIYIYIYIHDMCTGHILVIIVRDNAITTNNEDMIKFKIYYKNQKLRNVFIKNNPTKYKEQYNIVYMYTCAQSFRNSVHAKYIGHTTTIITERMKQHILLKNTIWKLIVKTLRVPKRSLMSLSLPKY